MDVTINSVWLTLLFWTLTTSTLGSEQIDQVTTPEPLDLTPSAVGQISEPPDYSGMIIERIPAEADTIKPPAPLEEKQEEEFSAVDDHEPVLVSFPDNHKNNTSNDWNYDFPPNYNYINKYQEQYKKYNEQRQIFNRKPIKFEDNANKNFYVSYGSDSVSNTQDDRKKSETAFFDKKPFPYVFEEEKLYGNWQKNTGNKQISVQGRPNNQYYVTEYQQEFFPTHPLSLSNFHDHKYVDNEAINSKYQEAARKKELENSWKKAFKVLTALVPLGLLLATLTPNYVSINSTTDAKTTRQRSTEPSPIKFKDGEALNLLKKIGSELLNESECEDRVICELAKKGNDPNADLIERIFWFLANETPWNVAEKAGMTSLFEEIKSGNCEVYKCHSKVDSNAKNNFLERFENQRKI